MAEPGNVLAWLDLIGVPWSPPGSPNVGKEWIGIQCIYCTDHHNHLGIQPAKERFHCWLCGRSGSLADLLCDLGAMSMGEALALLREWRSGTHLEMEGTRGENGRPWNSDLLAWCRKELSPFQRTYLKKRRFNPDHLQSIWGILGGQISGPWQHRIIIPVTLNGKAVTWIGMDATGKRKPKYKAAPARDSIMPSSKLVYGADMSGRNVLVVEGPTDAWRMGPGTIAMLGMTPTTDKICALLRLKADRYYIMLDGETQAQKHAREIAGCLKKAGKEASVIELDRGDPDDLPDETARELRDELEIGK